MLIENYSGVNEILQELLSDNFNQFKIAFFRNEDGSFNYDLLDQHNRLLITEFSTLKEIFDVFLGLNSFYIQARFKNSSELLSVINTKKYKWKETDSLKEVRLFHNFDYHVDSFREDICHCIEHRIFCGEKNIQMYVKEFVTINLNAGIDSKYNPYQYI